MTISFKTIKNGYILEDNNGDSTFYPTKKELLEALTEIVKDLE